MEAPLEQILEERRRRRGVLQDLCATTRLGGKSRSGHGSPSYRRSGTETSSSYADQTADRTAAPLRGHDSTASSDFSGRSSGHTTRVGHARVRLPSRAAYRYRNLSSTTTTTTPLTSATNNDFQLQEESRSTSTRTRTTSSATTALRLQYREGNGAATHPSSSVLSESGASPLPRRADGGPHLPTGSRGIAAAERERWTANPNPRVYPVPRNALYDVDANPHFTRLSPSPRSGVGRYPQAAVPDERGGEAAGKGWRQILGVNTPSPRDEEGGWLSGATGTSCSGGGLGSRSLESAWREGISASSLRSGAVRVVGGTANPGSKEKEEEDWAGDVGDGYYYFNTHRRHSPPEPVAPGGRGPSSCFPSPARRATEPLTCRRHSPEMAREGVVTRSWNSRLSRTPPHISSSLGPAASSPLRFSPKKVAYYFPGRPSDWRRRGGVSTAPPPAGRPTSTSCGGPSLGSVHQHSSRCRTPPGEGQPSGTAPPQAPLQDFYDAGRKGPLSLNPLEPAVWRQRTARSPEHAGLMPPSPFSGSSLVSPVETRESAAEEGCLADAPPIPSACGAPQQVWVQQIVQQVVEALEQRGAAPPPSPVAPAPSRLAEGGHSPRGELQSLTGTGEKRDPAASPPPNTVAAAKSSGTPSPAGQISFTALAEEPLDRATPAAVPQWGEDGATDSSFPREASRFSRCQESPAPIRLPNHRNSTAAISGTEQHVVEGEPPPDDQGRAPVPYQSGAPARVRVPSSQPPDDHPGSGRALWSPRVSVRGRSPRPARSIASSSHGIAFAAHSPRSSISLTRQRTAHSVIYAAEGEGAAAEGEGGAAVEAAEGRRDLKKISNRRSPPHPGETHRRSTTGPHPLHPSMESRITSVIPLPPQAVHEWEKQKRREAEDLGSGPGHSVWPSPTSQGRGRRRSESRQRRSAKRREAGLKGREQEQRLVPVALLHSNTTFDLPTSIRVLTRGDFFYFLKHDFYDRSVFSLYQQFSYDRPCRAEPRFLWLDTRSYLLVWTSTLSAKMGVADDSTAFGGRRSTLFRHRIKLEQIYQISCRSFVQHSDGQGDHLRDTRGTNRERRGGHSSGITYYVIGIQSAKEVVELTTSSQNKADTWYDALHNVCEFVRRTARDRRPEAPD